MYSDPDEIDFEQLKRHVLRRIQARMRPYSLDEAYGIPGRSTWRGLLAVTQEFHGDPAVRSLIGQN